MLIVIMKEADVLCPYLKEMRRIKKRNAYVSNEKKELRKLIDQTFEEIDEPKKEYWTSRIHAHLSRRLSFTKTKTRWIDLIGEFNDTIATGSVQQEKMKRYLLTVRDAAASKNRRQERKCKQELHDLALEL